MKMNNKKAKKMIESITGGSYTHLRKDGKTEGRYCLRFNGRPLAGIKPRWMNEPYDWGLVTPF
jgi:hypothetical protein